jgi:hypothetical protein
LVRKALRELAFCGVDRLRSFGPAKGAGPQDDSRFEGGALAQFIAQKRAASTEQGSLAYTYIG